MEMQVLWSQQNRLGMEFQREIGVDQADKSMNRDQGESEWALKATSLRPLHQSDVNSG